MLSNRTRSLITVVISVALRPAAGLPAETRQIISLDGTWEIAQGSISQRPEEFAHQVPVPGLLDTARPPFEQIGVKSTLREAFWYRRTFRVEGPVPEVALLKILKAQYGTAVWLNGQHAGDHWPCFTPGIFNVRPYLKGPGQANELLVRVGAFRDSLPEGIPDGWDVEKAKCLPGIYDSVELILCGTPHIVRVQTVPDLSAQAVRVIAQVRNDGTATEMSLKGRVREVSSSRLAGSGGSPPVQLDSGQERSVEFSIPIQGCRLWSPEDPFLYELEVDTGRDTARVRFGMRSFQFDKATGRAMLNGQPYYLRGTNVMMYRFFEDQARGDRPWREEWIRRLLRVFKGMHWNAMRYCIGFPPEIWYRLADEEGLLVQDEFPIWYDRRRWPAALKAEELIKEFTEWIHERCNHPCVVIWDAQNETVSGETGKAIQAVRHLDLSGRPWDNGWSPPQSDSDCFESHAYLFQMPSFRLSDFAGVSPQAVASISPSISRRPFVTNRGGNATIINEYGWLFLTREGAPTRLTKELYGYLLGADASAEKHRETYARYLAALTEFWRCHRVAAGVLELCGLTYNHPERETSDHFVDIEKLTLEPNYARYVRDAFSPVGLMIDEWADALPSGETRDFRVFVINDLAADWEGLVRFRIVRGEQTVLEKSQACRVKGFGREILSFTGAVPREPEAYQLVAELSGLEGKPVRSLRDFVVPTAEQQAARAGLAVGKKVSASSSITVDGVACPPEHATDGKRQTRWCSEPSDPQWIAVDLGEPARISRVELLWGNDYGRAYAIQVSPDGQAWKDVYATKFGAGGFRFKPQGGDGGIDRVNFPPTEARWVRLYGTQRGTPGGYSLWEFKVLRDPG